MKLITILILYFILASSIGSLGGTYYYFAQSENLIIESTTSELASEEFIQESRGELLRTSVEIIIAVFILFFIFGLILSIMLSKPLKKLTSNVDQITKGKLDIQLPKSRVFEIQKLTDALNRILASLKLAILKTGATKGELGLGEAIKAKKEAEEKYKALYESSRDAIMTLEPPKWNFAAGNPATIKMFGAKNEEEFISKSPGELSPKKQPGGKLSSEEAKKMIMKAMKKGSNFFNWTHKRISGEEFPATVLLTKVRIGGKDVLQATVREVKRKNFRKPIIKKKILKKTIPSKPLIKKLPLEKK